MKEELLHHIWQFQKFRKQSVKTTNGEDLLLLNKGFINSDSGPDFSNARIRIKDIEWAGHVEIHVKSSDWKRHKHGADKAYDNVILHVVWEYDEPIFARDGKEIPCLELKDITPEEVFKNYQSLINSADRIPCERQFNDVSELVKLTMFDKALMQRLQRKASIIHQRLEENKGDWEEAVYQTLLTNFGFKLNNEAFLSLAQNLPFRLLRKYQSSIFQLEALLFGVAGFLEEAQGKYGEKLKAEYNFLKAKHGLEQNQMLVVQWKFMRTRPGNFPTVRLVQIAGILVKQKSFFDVFTSSSSTFEDLLEFFKTEPSEYWQTHYHFEKTLNSKTQGIGKNSVENLIVNSVVPVKIAFAHYSDRAELTDQAIQLLEAIPAENNRITRFWKGLGLTVDKMSDSQGSIELYNEFCLKKKCLNCGIGVELLK
ncbi:DUF2851 family protein [Jiulongibacter sediminis]|uniref:DUF2851 domain-containing protein n=1 Tax=Jiulongibacter sediminis TaxID=1605367 RepID=A0A0P7BZ65_9BACT|nr:DUF2851 family protein [Jiulongibacter sediminis]KPM46905.1 hypothetical protein AFM12_16850 [Jiulongibacter sediminis]TBX22254.1 hypothetical protein TK44_16860 [Jiulongibacter sediminis]